MLKSQEPTTEAIKKALTDSAGNIIAASKLLKVGKTWLYEKINRTKALSNHLKEIRYDIVDEAEIALRKRIREGDTTAIIYTLKTMGKERGWAQNDW